MADYITPVKTVFLSSVAKGLEECRDVVYRAIEGLDGYHCDRMEDFGARETQPLEFCLERAAACDLFVGIVGQRYGSCPRDSVMSYTEAEYLAAAGRGVPTLMFVADEKFPVPADLIESDAMRQRLKAFRDQVLGSPTTKFFTSADQLGQFVTQSIHNHRETLAARQDQRVREQSTRTYLLFPFVSSSGGFDTGISVANTGGDPFGTAAKAGACTVHYYGIGANNASSPPPQISSFVPPGQVLTYVLSTGGGVVGTGANGLDNRGAGFQGYLIVECDFAHAYGFAYLGALGGGAGSPGSCYVARHINPKREDE